MRQIELTSENYLSIMEEVVADFGSDFVYQPGPRDKRPPWQFTRCTYNPTEHQGRCLHGEILHRMGYEVPLDFENGPVDRVLDHFGSHDYALAHAANEAQSYQDLGGTWGGALDSFKYELAGVRL